MGLSRWISLVMVACLVAILYLLPTLVYWKHNGTGYFPVTSFDEDFYAAIAVSTATGQSLLANPLLGETGHPREIGTETLMFLPRLLAAGMIRLFGLGLAFGLMSVLAPVVIFLLAYLLLRNFTGDHWWSLAGGCGLLLLPYYIPPIAATIHTVLHWMFSRPGVLLGFPENLVYSRRYNPSLSAMLFFAFLFLHRKSAQTKDHFWALLAGAAGGLLFYSYLYFALAAFVFSALYAGATLALKKDAFRNASLALVLQTLLSVPLFLILWINHRSYQTAFSVHSHALVFPTTDILAVLLPLLLLAARRHGSADLMWLACLGLAPVIAMNSQVITGMSVEPWHYDKYVIVPLSILLFCAACGILTKEDSRIGARLAQAFVCVALFAATLTQVHILRTDTLVGIMNTPKLTPVFQWIRARTAPDDVLLMGDGVTTAPWMVAATSRRVFVSFYVGAFPPAFPNEYRERAYCYYWLQGLDAAGFARGPETDTRSYLYAQDGFTFWFHPYLLTSDIKSQLAREYQDCSDSPQGCCARPFRADWLVESQAHPFDSSRLSQLYEVLPAYSDGIYTVSRLTRIRP
ncbi:MAG TPA: hypothetical protein VMJ93_18060 [Verrucomicrobiae bacterium]|nr:hypothetical protein [Verrucomicrobiae bacterium]